MKKLLSKWHCNSRPNALLISCLQLFMLVLFLQHDLPAATSERQFYAAGRFGAVSSGHPLATEAAATILKNGGNAVDAAVAAAFMLGVVDFSNSGIGGDGYALIRSPSGQIMAWDGSVKLPRSFSGKPGTHPLGLPTLPEMLLKLLRLYGSRNRAEIIAPAISTCLNGFKISSYMEKVLEKSVMKITDPLAINFLAPEGYPLRAGQNFKQPKLAETLAELVYDGGTSFYRGKTSAKIVADMQKHGSDYTAADMAFYRSIPTKPYRFSTGNFTISGNPPPASSMATIRLIKDLLDSGIDLNNLNPEQTVSVAQTGKNLLAIKYDGIARSINDPAQFMQINKPVAAEMAGEDVSNTTHICVWDRHGMIVSMTLTLGSHFGTGQFSPAGFFYNNGLRNYSPEVGGYPAAYPLLAGPVSAKSPLIILENGHPLMAIGGAGSNRIIFNTALAAARVIQSKNSFMWLNKKPRFFMDHKDKLHIEWYPNADLNDYKSFHQATELRIGCDDYFGLVSSIMASGSELIAIADHRRDGSCAAIRKPD